MNRLKSSACTTSYCRFASFKVNVELGLGLKKALTLSSPSSSLKNSIKSAPAGGDLVTVEMPRPYKNTANVSAWPEKWMNLGRTLSGSLSSFIYLVRVGIIEAGLPSLRT